MKKIFEKYGIIIVILIVLGLLFGVVQTVGAESIKRKIDIWISSFSNSTSNTINKIDSNKSNIEPTKGDVIVVDSKEYKVLSLNGNEATLLAMYDVNEMFFNSEEVTASFNGTDGIKYAGSDLDNYLENTFYMSLPFKEAIIPQNITQNMYRSYNTPNEDDETYTYQYQYNWMDLDYDNADFVGSVEVGTRHVYALDLKDIFDYLGKRRITSEDLVSMYYEGIINTNSWLRSAYLINSYYGAWQVFGEGGRLSNSRYNNTNSVRPAFVIDITKIEYTK